MLRDRPAERADDRALDRRPAGHLDSGHLLPERGRRDRAAPDGELACALVTSFSPFALLLPASAEDTQPPAISCASADGAWHAANVSIDCTAEDGGSGLADQADAAFSLSTSVAGRQ